MLAIAAPVWLPHWAWQLAANCYHAIWKGVLIFLVVFLLERLYHQKTARYLSWSFGHDLLYWFYMRSDFNNFLLNLLFLTAVSSALTAAHYDPLARVPVALRWAIFFIVSEFVIYWIHRAQHTSRFLWAFHSVHHSTKTLTFATIARFHPVDTFIANLLSYLPLIALGPAPQNWLPVVLVIEFLLAIEHSELPWRFGPLYRIVVSPTFHSFHHSIEPQYHDRNYGRILSIFDFMFGTAVDEHARPAEYGVKDLTLDSLGSQLTRPFGMAWQGSRTPAPAAEALPAVEQQRSQAAG